MNLKVIKSAILMMVAAVFSLGINAADRTDQYGFGSKIYLIQSAIEAGKSGNGLWDIPGSPNKTDGNLKGTNWQPMGVWQMEKGNPDDRVFRFIPSDGGRYFIAVGRASSWGINGIDGTGAVEARTRRDSFELKYLGSGKWKIYYKPGIVIGLASNNAKNGTKLVLLPDQNSPSVEWVFWDAATNKSFVPVSSTVTTTSYKGTLKVALSTKNPGTQYFEYADNAKFSAENSGKELQNYLNGMSGADQWTAILEIMKSIPRNKDVMMRRNVCKAVAEVPVTKGKGFVENALKGQAGKQIKDVAAKETDAETKQAMLATANKF